MSSNLMGIQVVLLAAGKGKRMRSEKPKVLHKVCGQTILERCLRAALALNPKRIVVVVGFGREMVEREIAVLNSQGLFGNTEVVCAVQSEQKGTGHAAAVGLAETADEVGGLLIMPADIPLITGETLQRFILQAKEKHASVGVLSCIVPDARGFGRIVRKQNGDVERITEQLDCTKEELLINEINSSIYFAERALMADALACLNADNAQGEYYLTDAVSFANSKGLKVSGIIIEDYRRVLGANSRSELSVLEVIRRSEINQGWMDQGVTFEDPTATYIDEAVVLGQDCYLGAGTRIHGRSVIAKNVTVEGNSLIENSEIKEGANIKFCSVIEDSVVGIGCQVGPFAHLRPGAVLEEDARVGNFVEIKKSVLHRGVKANHLTYLGDSDIGAGTNVGAGTITCNYDGKNKHRTEIGERCFIGSNTALVAPVRLESDVFIAAGSTITKDVPKQALGIARGKQRNIENWITKKRG